MLLISVDEKKPAQQEAKPLGMKINNCIALVRRYIKTKSKTKTVENLYQSSLGFQFEPFEAHVYLCVTYVSRLLVHTALHATPSAGEHFKRLTVFEMLWLSDHSWSSCLFRGLFSAKLFKKDLKSINRTLGVNGFELPLPLAIVATFQVKTTPSLSLSLALFYLFQKSD